MVHDTLSHSTQIALHQMILIWTDGLLACFLSDTAQAHTGNERSVVQFLEKMLMAKPGIYFLQALELEPLRN